MNLLNNLLQQLKDKWLYSSEELEDIKKAIIEYSTAVVTDSKVAEEWN